MLPKHKAMTFYHITNDELESREKLRREETALDWVVFGGLF